VHLTCSQGHQWELASGGPAVCPDCGAPAVSETGVTFLLQPDSPSPLTLSIRNKVAPVPEAAWPSVPGYEVLSELGRGGMGVVYKARQVGLDRVVALKMIGTAGDAEALARFRREAEAIARLQHPNIIQVYEVGTCPAGPFFVMEFAGGGSLADLWEGDPQPPREAAALVETLARAVHAAHERGIVHRDLKPANILLQKDEGGRMKDESRPRAEQRPGDAFLLPPSSFRRSPTSAWPAGWTLSTG
jgi:serine/threonine protein kinase